MKILNKKSSEIDKKTKDKLIQKALLIESLSSNNINLVKEEPKIINNKIVYNQNDNSIQEFSSSKELIQNFLKKKPLKIKSGQ